MTEASIYSTEFYEIVNSTAGRSAHEAVPTVLEFIRPRSVIDVGCGTGTWLAAFAQNGISDYYGVDGYWADTAGLRIPRERFQAVDLNQPIELERAFDLVVALEVAEHLVPQAAETFVDSLTRLGPVVLFSAAVPMQQGFHHVNEQWPRYWADLFLQRGFVAIDCLRSRLWQNRNIDWWYAQNMMFFVRADQLEYYPLLKQAMLERPASQPLPLIHPDLYLYRSKRAELTPGYITLKEVLTALPVLARYALWQHSFYMGFRKFLNRLWGPASKEPRQKQFSHRGHL